MNLVIELTYDCNLNCPWCVEKNNITFNKGCITPEKLSKLFEHIKNNEYTRYTFQGGEPLMYSDFMFEIADKIKSYQPDAKFNVFTNGTYLNFKLAKELNKRDFSSIISIDGHGYKSISNLINKYSLYPNEILESIISLNHKCIRTVITKDVINKCDICEDIILISHNIPNCKIEMTLDLTELSFTLDDMEKYKNYILKLRDEFPEVFNNVILMQGFKNKCNSHANWYFLNKDEITEKCPYSKRPESGCAHYIKILTPEVYEAYKQICELQDL